MIRHSKKCPSRDTVPLTIGMGYPAFVSFLTVTMGTCETKAAGGGSLTVGHLTRVVSIVCINVTLA